MKFLASAKSKVLAGVAPIQMATNGTVTGDLDPAPFTTMAIAVVTFVALVYAIKAGLRLLGR